LFLQSIIGFVLCNLLNSVYISIILDLFLCASVCMGFSNSFYLQWIKMGKMATLKLI